MSEPTAAAPLVSATTLADLPIRLAELVEYVLELTVQVDRISDRLEKFIMAAAATAPADTGNGQRRAQPAKYPGRLFTRARLRGDGSSRYVNEAAALYAVVKGADVEYADLEPCHDAETWRWQIKAVTA